MWVASAGAGPWVAALVAEAVAQADCATWAAAGECASNGAYMLSTCQAACTEVATLTAFASRVDNEYLRYLDPDPDQDDMMPNHAPREVESGHFVLVRPTPLPDPALVAVSAEMCAVLSLESACHSELFVRLFSGADVSGERFAASVPILTTRHMHTTEYSAEIIYASASDVDVHVTQERCLRLPLHGPRPTP